MTTLSMSTIYVNTCYMHTIGATKIFELSTSWQMKWYDLSITSLSNVDAHNLITYTFDRVITFLLLLCTFNDNYLHYIFIQESCHLDL